MSVIAVIDYGMGNIRSVSKAIEHVSDKHKVIVTSDAQKIQQAERVVVPGQGAIGQCLGEIKRQDLLPVIQDALANKPFLGICIGLQILAKHSEEDQGCDGLAYFDGMVKRFPDGMTDEQGERLKIPHMGWNQVNQVRPHALWEKIPQATRFYFVHSYYLHLDTAGQIAGSAHHGMDFHCAAAKDNVFAVQFHPEKSAQFGLQLLHNFVNWKVRG